MKTFDTWEFYRHDREALNETNDCVVRALSAFLDKPYIRVHKWCSDAMDRKHRKGVSSIQQMAKLLVYDNPTVSDLVTMSANSSSTRRFKHHIDMYGSDMLCQEEIDDLKDGVVDILPPENKVLTLGKFIKDIAKLNKKYLVVVKGHALAVVNGTVYDNNDIRSLAHVRFVWEK